MAQICECGKYTIFRLYLTINRVEPVYEGFYGTINIIWCLGELIECPIFAWCAPGMPKMANKVTKIGQKQVKMATRGKIWRLCWPFWACLEHTKQILDTQ